MLVIQEGKICVTHLGDLDKCKERYYEITVETDSDRITGCWFSDSERIVIAYEERIEIYNAMTKTKLRTVETQTYNSCPKVIANDIIVCFQAEKKINFYDV